MQLTHVLMKASLKLNLGWRPRDENQEADALTNEIFDLFSGERRILLHYADLPLSFLHSLYEARLSQGALVKRSQSVTQWVADHASRARGNERNLFGDVLAFGWGQRHTGAPTITSKTWKLDACVSLPPPS
eukprot:s1641_g9.t1